MFQTGHTVDFFTDSNHDNFEALHETGLYRVTWSQSLFCFLQNLYKLRHAHNLINGYLIKRTGAENIRLTSLVMQL